MKNIYVVCEVLEYYGDFEETNCVKAFTKQNKAEAFKNQYMKSQHDSEDKDPNVKFCWSFIDEIPLVEEED